MLVSSIKSTTFQMLLLEYLNQVKKYILYIQVKEYGCLFSLLFLFFECFFPLLFQLIGSSEKQRKGVGTEMNKEKKKEREKKRGGKKKERNDGKTRGIDTAYHCSLSLILFRNDDYMLYISCVTCAIKIHSVMVT